MWGYFLIAALAVLGTVCAVWTLWGLCLTPDEGKLVYMGPAPVEFARRYLWLREMGLLRCPLAVQDPEPEAKQWLLDRGIEIRNLEEQLRHEMGENRF